MTKKGAQFFQIARRKCIRYKIIIPVIIDNFNLTVSEIQSLILNKITNIEILIVSIERKVLAKRLQFYLEYQKGNVPNLSSVKSDFRNLFKDLNKNVFDYQFYSVNNRDYAISHLTEMDFDACIYGIPPSSKCISESYRLENWARTRAQIGTFDRNEEFVKTFSKVSSVKKICQGKVIYTK